MKRIIDMANKAIRRVKKSLYVQKKQQQLQSKTLQEKTSINLDNLITDLISVDTMLCNSFAIASQQFQTDSNKLLEIIRNHHIGLEVSLAKIGVNVYRSKSGDDFNPEIMQAHSMLISTEDPNLHGKVAISVSPRFIHIQSAPPKETLLQLECVMLYKYMESK